MKVFLFLFASIILFSGCMRDNRAVELTSDQVSAVQKMQSSYAQAKLYNDSLIMLTNSGNPDMVRMHQLDQVYHQHDAAFESCHHNYEHNTTSADHSHDGQGMVQMHGTSGGMMGGGCQCCTNGGHKGGIHHDMDALHTLHAQYHPH